MSDTIYSRPGETFYSELDNAPTGMVGTLGVRVLAKSDESTVTARTTAGIVESPAGSGRYKATLTAPNAAGAYTVLWDTGTVSPTTTASDDLSVTYDLPPTVQSGPLYATPDDLRKELKVSAEMLPDEEANGILTTACDLIDERLGIRPIDPETGRKVKPDEVDAWRARKLAEATIEVAAVIFSDPDVARRQRARFSSGDVSVSGFYGPAFGERSAALLNQSGLVVNTARMSGGARRRCR